MRFWEIDAARGAAVVLMVVSNFFYDLHLFGVMSIDLSSFFFFWFPRLIAGAFIFVSGLSFTISYARNRKVKHHALRGARIFALGLLITAATYFLPGTIYFGILHFIGIATILSIASARVRENGLLLLSGLFILAGIYLQTTTFANPYLLWLGLMPHQFYSYDYFPLLPWFGVTLLGIYAGRILYAGGKRRFKISSKKSPLLWIGRNSLLVYFVHQPVIAAVLYLLGYSLIL